MSAPVTQDFDIVASPHYPAKGNLHVMCPYGQGVIQSWSSETGMVKVKLAHGGTISIMRREVFWGFLGSCRDFLGIHRTEI